MNLVLKTVIQTQKYKKTTISSFHIPPQKNNKNVDSILFFVFNLR